MPTSNLGKKEKRRWRKYAQAAAHASPLGMEVHAGHGLDYKNVQPVAAIPEITEFSIGFAIVARAAIVGVDLAVREMISLIG